MKNFYTCMRCFIGIVCAQTLIAQGYTYTLYSGSDYYMYVDYKIDKFCDCTDGYSFAVYNSKVSASNFLGSGNKKSGKITMKIGPSRNIKYHMSVSTNGKSKVLGVCLTSCTGTGSQSKTKSTSKIRYPTSASASNDKDVIELKWVSNTDIPASQHYYRIARDSPDNIIASKVSGVAKGQTRTFTDDLVGPDTTHLYYISTVTDSWGGDVSSANSVRGYTRDRQMKASEGQARQVSLSWDDLSNVTSEAIIRRDGSQIAEVNINSAADTAYSDSDPALVPGKYYNYSIAWTRGNTEYILSAEGASQANGRISGKIQTPLTQLPISGVEVCITQENSLDQSPAGTTYCDTTDEFGNYEIRRIYYGNEATFTVIPSKENHDFDPIKYEGQRLELEMPGRTLNFDDTTAFVVSGRIAQFLHGDTCGLAGVEIWVDGLFKGTKTDNEGYYSLGVEESGTYEIEARLLNHEMNPGSQTVSVDKDVIGIDFLDGEVNLIEGVVKAACDLYIGGSSVRLYSGGDNVCFDTTVVTDSSGYYSALLPARKYDLEVIDFQPRSGLVIDRDEVLSYFNTIIVDLTAGPKEENFIFRRPPQISVVGLPAQKCPDLGVSVVEQNEVYELLISVSETFGEESCLVESGTVIVYDEVGDRDGQPDTIQLEGGKASYFLKAGAPNLIAPHHKLIQIVATVEEEQSDWSETLLVTGLRPREQTFATVMPEMPFMILHDPPGDASYSYREEQQTSEMAFRIFGNTESSIEAKAEVKFGSAFEVSDITGTFATGFASWGTIGGSLAMGARLASQSELVLTTETVERFSTSDNAQITGQEGDLYIGAAINMVYALADVLSIDANTCQVDLSQNMIMGNDGFATTFMYTEDHVQNVLLPQLQQIQEIYVEQESDSAEIYRNQISVWQQVLDNNRRNKQKARLIENRSFSAGAAYHASSTFQSQTSSTIEISAFIDASVAIGAGFEIAGSGVSGSVETRLSVELGASATGTTLKGITTGFELNDDDQGDFFSVNIREDPTYGTPVFDVVSGRSSCPKEDFTQSREEVQLQSDAYAQFNIPEDVPAVFVLDLGNISQSDEPRTYLFKLLQESNPDGAVVTIGGSQAQAPIPFTIPAGGKRSATITIARGARAYNYNNLQFVIQSGCEDEMIADTVALSVSFQSDYPDIQIVKPNPVWTANTHNGNEILVRFAGFDVQRLKKVQLQYAPANSYAWQTGKEWLPGALEGFNGDFSDFWGITDLKDGTYDLRFKADYGDGEVFSEIHQGMVDRTGPQILGLPEPADRELLIGDAISISFQEHINCVDLGSNNVVMQNPETEDFYPVQIGCSDERLIISPLWNLIVHEGEEIKMQVTGIKDLFGNQSQDSVYTWSFIVGSTSGLDDNDVDLDGIENQLDNCSLANNPSQSDLDKDGIGDACDEDIDGDGFLNIYDNCMQLAGDNQDDLDEDGIGDMCDDDMDGDGVPNTRDNCPTSYNPLQGDCDDAVTGVENHATRTNISIYPNPADDWIKVRMTNINSGNINLSIQDINGRVVIRKDGLKFGGLEESEEVFNVSKIPSGSYILSVNSATEQQYVRMNIVH